MTLSNPRTIALFITLFLGSALITLTFRHSSRHHHWTIPNLSNNPSTKKPYPLSHGVAIASPKVAFATFLTTNLDKAGIPLTDPASTITASPKTAVDEGNYLSARVLAYQLLHSTTAGTNASIPFLVLCTPSVSAEKRAQLQKDGATVIVVGRVGAEKKISPALENWSSVLSKLRVFEMTQYHKICFLDANTLVTAPLDGVFYDEATLTQATLPDHATILVDEAPLPRTYMLAGHGDRFEAEANLSMPPEPSYNVLNSGFFIFTPDKGLFEYYVSLLSLPGRFEISNEDEPVPVETADSVRAAVTIRVADPIGEDSVRPRAANRPVGTRDSVRKDSIGGLLNYAHRWQGNMPWKLLWYGWNVNLPKEGDLKGGARSFTARFWDQGDGSVDEVLRGVWREQRAEMEGFYRGREGD